MIYTDIKWAGASDSVGQIKRVSDSSTIVMFQDSKHIPCPYFLATTNLDEAVARLDDKFNRVEQPLPYRIHVWSPNEVTELEARFSDRSTACEVMHCLIDNSPDPLNYDLTNVNTGVVIMQSEVPG